MFPRETSIFLNLINYIRLENNLILTIDQLKWQHNNILLKNKEFRQKKTGNLKEYHSNKNLSLSQRKLSDF